MPAARYSRTSRWVILGLLTLLSGCEGCDSPNAVRDYFEILGGIQASGFGIVDADMELWRGGTRIATTRTDANGGFRFGELLADRYTVRAFVPDEFELAQNEREVVLEGQPRTVRADFSVDYRRAAHIAGFVVAGEDPVRNATVSLSGVESRTTQTDTMGRYSFGSLRAGAYSLSFTGFDNRLLDCATTQYAIDRLQPRDTLSYNFNCANISSTLMAGFFFDDHPRNGLRDGMFEQMLPLGGIPIHLSGEGVTRSAVSDTQGRVSFTSLPSGTYQLRADTLGANVPDSLRIPGQTLSISVAASSSAYLNLPASLRWYGVDVPLRYGTEPVTGAEIGAATARIGPTLTLSTSGASGTASLLIPRDTLRNSLGFLADSLFVHPTRSPTGLFGVDTLGFALTPFASRLQTDTLGFYSERFRASMVLTSPGGRPYGGWSANLLYRDSVIATAITDTTGRARFDYTLGHDLRRELSLSRSLDFTARYRDTQPQAGANSWRTDIQPASGAQPITNGATFTWSGFYPAATGDVDLGSAHLRWNDANLRGSVLREGGGFDGIGNVELDLYRRTNGNAQLLETVKPSTTDGRFTFSRLQTGISYEVQPRVTAGSYSFVPDWYDVGILRDTRRNAWLCDEEDEKKCPTFMLVPLTIWDLIGDGNFDIVHVVGVTLCPQLAVTLTLRNMSTLPATLITTAQSPLLSVGFNQGSVLPFPRSNVIPPGGEVTVQVYFNCGAAQNVNSSWRLLGNVQGQTPLDRTFSASVRMNF
jgi:hypothetical protein